jgi:hypothetical protein
MQHGVTGMRAMTEVVQGVKWSWGKHAENGTDNSSDHFPHLM